MSVEEYVVQVRDGIGKTGSVERKLEKMGLTFVVKSQKTQYWEKKNVSPKNMKQIKKFCKRHLLQIEIIDQRFTGSSNYRKEFFQHYKPVFQNYYFCIYCGKLLTRKNLQVDHIIPIHKAKTSKWVRWYLERYPKGVNDYRNLGASCRNCNLTKSAKMGFWTIRGKIGKFNFYQILRWIIRVLIVAATIVMLYLYRENILEFFGA